MTQPDSIQNGALELSVLADVPRALADFAPKVAMGRDAGQRLLTDIQMARPWREIVKCAERLERNEPDEFRSRLERLDNTFRPETWDPDASLNLWERAVCSIYLGVCSEFAVQRPAVHKTALETEIQRWRQGAALCREASGVPHRSCVDPSLRDALEKAATYFDQWAELMEEAKETPSFVARGGRKARVGGRAADDVLRVRTRAIAQRFQAVLGTTLAGTVATVMKISFGDEASNITAKDVQNWSSTT